MARYRFQQSALRAAGACVDTCPVGAISMEDKAVVDAASCVGAIACRAFAPPALSG